MIAELVLVKVSQRTTSGLFQKDFICSINQIALVGIAKICIAMIITCATTCSNAGAQLEALEMHLGFHIGFLHDFDHSFLRTTCR